MDIEEILAKLDKKTRSRVMAAQEISLDRLPVSSLGLTKALGGGFGYGRQSVIYGNKSAGKSSICLQMIADAQKEGKTCAWIDAEGTYDPTWATRLGVDNSQLIVAPSKSIDEFTAVGCDLMSAGVDVIVADSISAMLPSTYFEKEDELKQGLEGTKQIGQSSKELGIAVNKFNATNKKTALVLISQVRNQFNTYGASQKPMGGFAVMFFSTTVVKLWSSASEREQLTGEVVIGDKIVSKPVGRPVSWTVEYNKIGPPNQIGNYDFYYGGDNVGVDLVGEIVTLAEQHGLISKAGGWYTFEGEKYHGKKMINYFKENPEKTEEIYRKIFNA